MSTRLHENWSGNNFPRKELKDIADKFGMGLIIVPTEYHKRIGETEPHQTIISSISSNVEV